MFVFPHITVLNFGVIINEKILLLLLVTRNATATAAEACYYQKQY